MSEATFTFRVDQTLKNAFSTAAKAHDRTGAQLLRDFMRESPPPIPAVSGKDGLGTTHGSTCCSQRT